MYCHDRLIAHAMQGEPRSSETPTIPGSTLTSPGQIVETMTDEERRRFGSAYCDLLEVCRHMEIKQGVCRHVVVGALLATVMTLCGNSQDYAEVLEVMNRN